ncbi:NUDIX hydrolase [Streptomyces sp. AJS327]|uniref:NUDIX hydrolase n=1 Tax=Streptomyces sp. AJS327 TaxID=2545265 RepID=UPI0015DEE67D|nr:NUDIX hydrolase [Streptomyces sp. AJS327]MBA0049683.1 NUDIX hydrolase [Streptomyces sp. AJS327]
MTDATPPYLATGPRGMTLRAFHRVPEHTRFEDAQVGYALLAVWHRGRVLLVHERERGCWELPGGGIEPDETPREAAARELREETGQLIAPAELRFAGFTKTGVGVEQRLLYGALFVGEVTEVRPFEPNTEISAIHWRAPGEPLPPYGQEQTVDTYLVARCGPPS